MQVSSWTWMHQPTGLSLNARARVNVTGYGKIRRIHEGGSELAIGSTGGNRTAANWSVTMQNTRLSNPT